MTLFEKIQWLRDKVPLGSLLLPEILDDICEGATLDDLGSNSTFTGENFCERTKEICHGCRGCKCESICNKQYGYEDGWENYLDAPAGSDIEDLNCKMTENDLSFCGFCGLKSAYETAAELGIHF